MPSQLQHELNKIKGIVSKTKKISTESIALLRDTITNIEITIKELQSINTNYNSRINNAISKATSALASAKASVKKSGDYVGHTFKFIEEGLLWINANRIRFDRNSYSYIENDNAAGKLAFRINGIKIFYIDTSDIVTDPATSLKINTIVERSAGSGVTLDTLLIKDNAIDEGDLHACKVLSDVKTAPEEGDLRMDTGAHKLQVYNGGAWETITSA